MPSVIIIGGGVAGLTAANQLHQNGIDFLLFAIKIASNNDRLTTTQHE